MPTSRTSGILASVPPVTLDWLLEEDNPAVAVLTRRTLLREDDSPGTTELWARRNDYAPVAAILDAIRDDGSWDVPSRDYQKYRGSLWQIHFLGELHTSGEDERVRRGAEYAFSRQKPDGGWSANPTASYDMPCLTANVGRALARMGWGRDERVVRALDYVVSCHARLGFLGCTDMSQYSLNGYCHMLTPKLLLFLSEVPRDAWPDGAEGLRGACVAALRDKQVHRCLPSEFKEFEPLVWGARAKERPAVRERFLAEHPVLTYGDKPGWLRFGFPLSYNSDALESLAALAAIGEPRRPEYEPALTLVENTADGQMRWAMRNSFNGKMFANVETKGAPSKWLTLRALQVLEHFGR